jgi:hypothetical protein
MSNVIEIATTEGIQGPVLRRPRADSERHAVFMQRPLYPLIIIIIIILS